MKVRYAALVTLAVAVTLTSVAAAGPAATKQRVAINMKISSSGRSCSPRLQAGADEERFGSNHSVDKALPTPRVAR